MHAYLLVSQNLNLKSQIEELAEKLKAKILEFPIVKIEDTRNLNNLIRLSFNQPTLIVSKNIHEATEEALNAFLKNLEEPQENIYFALTAPSAKHVLPTIISRCQIIKIKNDQKNELNYNIEEFLKMSVGEKLAYIDKIKNRESAIEFTENSIRFLHSQLISDRVKYNVVAKNIEIANKTLSRLKANGNIGLQLANFVINYV